MVPSLTRLVIYTKKMDAMMTFYCRYFAYVAHTDPDDRIIELRPTNGGAILMLHPAGKATKMGQSIVKLTFDVADVGTFANWCAEEGLAFGAIHTADGYQFANAKDPSGNSISISSRSSRPTY